MATTNNNSIGAYADTPDLGEREHERAVEHRERALSALAEGERVGAVVHALLALEARIDELTTWHVATR